MAKLNENNIIYDGTKKVSIDGIDVYTSNEVENKLIVKADINDVYNKSEVENKLNLKANKSDLSNFASRAELKNKVDDTVVGNLGNTGFKNNNTIEDVLIEIKEELDKKQARTDSGNIKNEISKVNTIIGNIRQTGFNGNTIGEQLREAKVLLDGNRFTRSSQSVDLSNYYTKSEVYNKEEVDQKITHVATGGSVDLSNYATKQELASKADTSSLSTKLDSSVYNSEKSSFATKQELASKADTTEVSRIDSRVSSVESNISTKADNTDYQATKRSLVSLESKVGNLQGTGLTGSTVTELLTDAKTRIDSMSSNGGTDLSNYYTKLESDAKYALITDLNTKADASLIGTLGNTGVTGATVEAQLTEVKRLIDGLPAGGSAGGNGQDPRIGDLSNLTTTEKSTVVGAINELVTSTVKLTNVDDIVAEADAGGFRVFKTGVKYFEMPDDPTLNNKQQWHYTINAFTFTSNGNMLIVSDMRASSNSDQGAIAPLYAASTNNGWSFTKGLVANRLMNGGNAGQARMMDPTIVHVPALNKTYILYGYWKVGGRNWQENNGTASTPGDSATNWTGALLAETSDLSNFTTRTIGKSGSDIDLSSAGLPSDCRGFLGGVGAGFVHSSGKVIIPIQWTKGLNDIRGGVLIGTVSDSDLRFEFKPSLTCTNSNEGLAGIGENNIFEGPNGKLIMVGRYYSAFKGSNTDAQMTPNTNFCAVAESSDFGDTWTMLSCSGGRYASKIRHAGCQGSTINFTTMNGVKCVLGSRPFGGDRSGVSIFGIKDDGTNVEVKYFKVINKNVAQAYSCLSHYKNEIGQKLGLSFEVNEFNGKTCRFDDISDIIPEVERWFRGDVSTGELNTKITELETRMDGLEMGEDSTRDSYISSDRILTLRANGFNNDTKTWEDGTGVSLSVVSPTSLSQTFTDGVEISPVDARLLRISSNNRMFYSTFSGSKFTNDACTLQFLLRIQTNKNADWRPYIAFSSGNHSSSSNYRIAFSPNINLNQIMQCCNASGGYAAAASLSKRVPTQELVMMTIVLGDTFKLYMNGEEILSKGKAGGSWGLSDINTLTIGNKINDNYNGVVEIGDVIVYNKALSPEQVKFNYSKAFGIDLNIGSLTSLETENKTDVVSAVNEVLEVANTKLTSDDFTVKQTASFVNDSTIDDSGRTWTPTVGSDGFSWQQGDSNFAVSKDTDGLKVVVAAVNFNINKLPTMPLANYLSGINSLVDSGLTIQFDYKLGDQLSNLGQWPAVFGIKRTGEDSLYFSLGLTKAESGTNYNLNYHYLNRSGNRTTGKNNTTVPSNGVITITVKIKADTLDLYANTDLVVSLQTYNVDLEKFLDKIMLGQNYQFSGSNSKSSSIFGNFKIYKGAYSADAISKGIPGWLSSLATAIKALP